MQMTWKYLTDLHGKFRANLLVKEFWKSVHICKLFYSLSTVIQQQSIVNDPKICGYIKS